MNPAIFQIKPLRLILQQISLPCLRITLAHTDTYAAPAVAVFIQADYDCPAAFRFFYYLNGCMISLESDTRIFLRQAASFLFFFYRAQRIIKQVGFLYDAALSEITFMRTDRIPERMMLFICLRIWIYCGFEHGKPDHPIPYAAPILAVV